MKNKTIYYLLLTLCILPSIAIAMEAGLPHQEKDPQGEVVVSTAATSSAAQKISEGKQEIENQLQAVQNMDLSRLAKETIPHHIDPSVIYPEALDLIRKRIAIPTKMSPHMAIRVYEQKILATCPTKQLVAFAIRNKTSGLWSLEVRDIATGKNKKIIQGLPSIVNVALSPDGTYVACANNEGLIEVFDVHTCNLYNAWQNRDKVSIDSCAFNEQNELISAFRVHDTPYVATNDVLKQTRVTLTPPSIMEPKIDTFFDRWTGSFKSWALSLDQSDAELEPMLPLTPITVSPKGTYVMAAYQISKNYKPTAFIWNTAKPDELLHVFRLEAATKELIPTNNLSLSYAKACFSADEKYVAILWTGFDDASFWDKNVWPPSHISVYDLETGEEINTLCKNKIIFAFALNNNTLITINSDSPTIDSSIGAFDVWDVATGNQITKLKTALPNHNILEIRMYNSARYHQATYMALNNTMLVAAYDEYPSLKIFTGIDLYDKNILSNHISKNFKKGYQLILLKSLLTALAKAAKEDKQVTLYPEDKMLFSKLPANVQAVFKNVVHYPHKLSWAEKYIYPRLARLLPTPEE